MAIIEADSCQQSSAVRRKVRLSNVLLGNNTNFGGSTGLVVRDPSCHDEVELRDVAFEGNKYLNASMLARENTLANVSVVANRRIANTNNRRTSFFHFPANSSSIVTNMTAIGNANAPVLYVERGKLNVSSSFFHNNEGKWRALVRVVSSSLTMHETRFLNNTCHNGFVAVTAEEASSVYFFSCTFAENVARDTFPNRSAFRGYFSIESPVGIVLASIQHETSFLFCDFIKNVVSSSVGSTLLLKGFGRPVNKKTRQRKSAELIHCRFLGNKSFYTTAVKIIKFYDKTVLFDSCEIRNNRMPEYNQSFAFPPLSATIKLEDSYVQNFTTKNCTFQSNSDTDSVLLFSSVNGTFWIRSTSFSVDRARFSWQAGVLSVQRWSAARVPSWAKTISNRKAILNVEDSDFKGDGEDSDFKGDGERFPGSAVLISDEQTRVKLRNSRFLGNRAEKGAAVHVENAFHLLVASCKFVQNKATEGGGAMHIESIASPRHLKILNTTFTRNTGQYGGAINAGRGIRVLDSHFRENRANVKGGAMNIECPTKDQSCNSCELHVQRSTFTENRAARSGGALHVSASCKLTAKSCRFYKNEARFGGGISFFRGPRTGSKTVKGSEFTENSAEMGGETQGSLCKFKGSLGVGAISVLATADAGRSLLYYGGRYMIDISNTAIMHNTATLSGAGIFAENPSAVVIDGKSIEVHKKPFNCQKMERPPSKAIGKNFRNNTVFGGNEENLASLSVGFCLYVFKGGSLVETISGDKKYTLPKWRSGDDFPVLRVVTHDQYGNNFTRTTNKDFLEKTSGYEPEEAYDQSVNVILSPKTKSVTTSPFLRNSVYGDISTGDGNISVGNPYVKPGRYQLILVVEGFEEQNVTLEVQVRDCTINEQSDRNDTFCRPCDSNQYNFHSADLAWNCTLCPDNADCTTAFIFPREGYWNAFPCSNQIERCVYEKACSFTGSDMVEELTRSETPCAFSDEVIEQYQSSQCAAGYDWPLCGSCLNDTGRLGSSVCTPCMSEFLAAVGQLGILLFQLFLALLPIRETLNAESDQLEDRTTTSSLARRTSRAIRPPGRYESFGGGPSSRGSRSAKKRVGGTTQSTARKVNRAKRRFLGTLKVTCPLDRDRISVLCYRSPSIFSRRWQLQPHWTSPGTSPPSLSSEPGVSSRIQRKKTVQYRLCFRYHGRRCLRRGFIVSGLLAHRRKWNSENSQATDHRRIVSGDHRPRHIGVFSSARAEGGQGLEQTPQKSHPGPHRRRLQLLPFTGEDRRRCLQLRRRARWHPARGRRDNTPLLDRRHVRGVLQGQSPDPHPRRLRPVAPLRDPVSASAGRFSGTRPWARQSVVQVDSGDDGIPFHRLRGEMPLLGLSDPPQKGRPVRHHRLRLQTRGQSPRPSRYGSPCHRSRSADASHTFQSGPG